MRIFVVAPFCSLPGEPHLNRFLQLAIMLSKLHDVTLVTSSFRHFDKTRRACVKGHADFSVVLIDEPGYKTNVSIARAYSHARFFRNFRAWFIKEMAFTKVDVIYSAYPLISTNIYLGKVKNEYGYKLILDVQDIWPESIASVMPALRYLSPRWLPFSKRADKAYRSADALVAVSTTYLHRAQLANPIARSKVVYIGCDSSKICTAKPFALDPKIKHFVYIGTLSYSYDLHTVIRGFSKIWNEGEKGIFFHVLGDGPDRKELESLAAPNTKFYGYLNYAEMLSFLKSADVCINALSLGAQQSITNKFCDYVFSGKYIVNSQTSLEVLDILKNISHVNYFAGNVDSFISAIKFSKNCTVIKTDKEVLRKFDRSISYPELVDFIEHVAK